mmetsp:Transcript_42358/g.133437  ORF Transcript_42358/g.133437 Transcript_42358/m.133437 type:complete len:177 (+) Transcript_42358:58-588(+)
MAVHRLQANGAINPWATALSDILDEGRIPLPGNHRGDFSTTYTHFHGGSALKWEVPGISGVSPRATTPMRKAGAAVIIPGRPVCRFEDLPTGPPPGGRPRRTGGQVATTGGVRRFGRSAMGHAEAQAAQVTFGSEDHPSGRRSPRRKYRGGKESTPLLAREMIVREPIVLKGDAGS